MLGHVLERLEAAEVHGALDLGRVAADARRRRPVARRPLLRARAADAPRRARGRRAARGRRRAPATGPPRAPPRPRLRARAGARRPGAGSSLHEVPGEPEPDPQGDEPLLGPVVEVALDAPALAVGRRLDASPRLAQLPQRRRRPWRRAAGSRGPPARPSRRLDELALVAQRGVVHEACHEPISVANLRERPPRALRRESAPRCPSASPSARGARNPVDELERGILDGLPQHRGELARAGMPAKPHGQALESGPREQLRSEQADDEPDGDSGDAQDVEPPDGGEDRRLRGRSCG